jgi:hypothetical protein
MISFELGYWLVVGGGALILLAIAVRSTRPRRPFTRRRSF